MRHEYRYSEDPSDDLKLADTKKLLMKKQRELIPMSKIKGREDNMVYRINEGYNLDESDGTFFDEFKLKDLFSGENSVAQSTQAFSTSQILMNLEKQKKNLSSLKYDNDGSDNGFLDDQAGFALPNFGVDSSSRTPKEHDGILAYRN